MPTVPRQTWMPFFWISSTLVLAAFMVLHPMEIFQAATKGITTWWTIVFPALFPFLVISDLLMSMGLVHLLGILLEPVMRPLFNVPGSGAYVMAVGYTSGCPIGAVLTANLRQQGMITRIEGERLIAFTNNASPLFMLGAIAVGMFQRPELGLTLAAAHYLANLSLGLMLRLADRRRDPEQVFPLPVPGSRLQQAWQAMLRTPRTHQSSLGQMLGNAVKKSSNTIVMIGGFIILFAVIIEVLHQLGLMTAMAHMLQAFGWSPNLATALATGFWEMTLGSKLVAATPASLAQQLVAVSIILGWSGISIHAQTSAVLAQTDIKMTLYFITRIGHAVLAPAFALLLVGPAAPVFRPLTIPLINAGYSPTTLVAFALLICLLMLLTALTAAMLAVLVRKTRIIWGFWHR